MKYIKIFLASSIGEFEKERREIGNFIRTLNDIYVRWEIYFQLVVCEDLSNAMVKGRKQQDYNEQIRDSQYFYVLFGKKAGDYTLEEFEVALEYFHSNGEPLIYTYFKELLEGECAEQSVVDFKERLDKQLGHYYSGFSHLDTIKLDMILELSSNLKLSNQMKFEDGWTVLDSERVLPLENIPMYSKNEAIQQLDEEQIQLNEEFAKLVEAHHKNPEDMEIFKLLSKVGERRKRVAESLYQIEMDMLELRRRMSERRRLGKKLNWREEKAVKLMDEGEYEAAKSILRDAQWEQELKQAEEFVESAKEPIREYISGKQMLIFTLEASWVNVTKQKEIDSIYKKICAKAEQHCVEMDVLYEYSVFLQKHHRYAEGIAMMQKLRLHYGQAAYLPKEEKLKFLLLMGKLYRSSRDYPEAVELYKETLETAKCLTEENRGEYEEKLAESCKNFANLMKEMNNYKKAEELYQEALEIYRRLEGENPTQYELEVVRCCDEYANLMSIMGKHEKAESAREESEKISKRIGSVELSEELSFDIDGYAKLMRDIGEMDTLALTCLAFASKVADKKAARMLYERALGIYQNLAKENPKVYEPNLAMSYSYLAELLRRMEEYREAKGLYVEALQLYRKLAEKNPKVYEPELAVNCRDMGILLQCMEEYEKARGLYMEALNIHRKFAENTPAVYEPQVATDCLQLGDLLGNMKKYEEAGKFLVEAVEIFIRFMEEIPNKYENLLVLSSDNLICLLKINGKFREVGNLYRRILKLYGHLEENNPEKYAASFESFCDKLINLANNIKNYNKIEEQQEILEIYRCLAEVKPEKYEPDMADICHNLAYALKKVNKSQQAGKLYKEALEIRKRLYDVEPEIYASKLAISYRRMAEWLYDAEKKEESKELYQELLQLRRHLAATHLEQQGFMLANDCKEVALLMTKEGEYKKAAELYEEAREIYGQLSERNPQMYKVELTESCRSLADIMYDIKEYGKAKELYKNILGLYKSMPGKDVEVKYIQKLLKKPVFWLKSSGSRNLYRHESQ